MSIAKAVRELRLKYGLDPDKAVPLPTSNAKQARKSSVVKGDPLSLMIVALCVAEQFGSPHLTAQYKALADDLAKMKGTECTSRSQESN